MAAALTIRMDDYLLSERVVALRCQVVKTLTAAQTGDASRMEGISEIRHADLLKGSSSGGRLLGAPLHFSIALPGHETLALILAQAERLHCLVLG